MPDAPLTSAEFTALTSGPNRVPVGEVPIEWVPSELLRVWADTCGFAADFAGRIAPALGKPRRVSFAEQLMADGAAEYLAELARRGEVA